VNLEQPEASKPKRKGKEYETVFVVSYTSGWAPSFVAAASMFDASVSCSWNLSLTSTPPRLGGEV
jgi:hypothetical protein